ncbi:MAG: hypothetical protein IPG38_04220 [Chitinophagaceae bacterium]|nr:hypothetical protein [Chitinophagaceae bacterium]
MLDHANLLLQAKNDEVKMDKSCTYLQQVKMGDEKKLLMIKLILPFPMAKEPKKILEQLLPKK